MFKFINYKILVIILMHLTLVRPLIAQDFNAKAVLDSTQMIIGHQSKLTLEVIKAKDIDVAFPIILDTLVNKVEVLSIGKIDTNIINDNRLQLTQELLITSFDSGFYYLPPFEFDVISEMDSFILKTDPLALKIYTYQIDSIAGIFDIKPVKEIKLKFSELVPFFMWIVITALLIFIAIALYWRFKKKQPLFFAPSKPKEPAYITAFRDLERIRDEKLWEKEEEKRFFTELTQTLRTYLEGRYGVLAMEQTSDEILKEVKGVVSKEHYKKIEGILRLADLVKFAKMRPLLSESENCIKNVYAFVDETKFIPETTEDSEIKSSEAEKDNLEQ